MKKIVYFIFFANLIQFQAFGQDKSLIEARDVIRNSKRLMYLQEAIYPNPMGSNDTLRSLNEFDLENYNFKFSSSQYEELFIADKLNVIDHKQQKVKFFRNNKEVDIFKSNNRNVIFSPVELLKLNWTFKKESIENTSHYNVYYSVDTDTIVDGNSIKTDFYIYINGSTNLIDKFERKNYFKGELSQTIQVFYKNQKINSESYSLNLTLPDSYYSEPYFSEKNKAFVNKGEKAIIFDGTTLDGENIELNQFKGKRILLVFSTLNCGYCIMTAEYLVSDNFNLKDNYEIIYLKPLDSKDHIQEFKSKFFIDYPIIEDSKQIADIYGVSGYPTFLELNEDLIIEEIKLGFSKEFLRKFNKIK